MFLNDLKSCMTNSSDVNAYFSKGGAIRYLGLPVNFDKTSYNWIKYTYKKTNSEDSSDMKDVVAYYDLYVLIVSPDIITLSNINETLNYYLCGYDDGKIRDISLSEGGDNYEYDDELKTYYCEATYEVLYMNDII